MKLHLLLPALLLLATACNRNEPAPAAPAGDAAATASQAPAAAPAAPAVDPAAREAITRILAAAETAPPPVAGTDYVEIPGGQPFEPLNGKIEIVEAFGYTCPHCANFQPLVNAWKEQLPPDVRFTYVAAPFGGYWVPYAKAYYTAEALGLLDRTHDAVFQAIHLERTLPVQPLPSDAQIAAFYARYGADPKQFAETMSSFAINAKLNRARQFLQRTGVEGTPTLIINGKYRVTARTLEDSVRIATQLVALERAAAGASPAAPVAEPPAPEAAPPASGQ
nr:thiol:disulfide interchange protein DsbA/DsbL [Vulcaniibacterium gelatinicum]